jgi:hypothetical protein
MECVLGYSGTANWNSILSRLEDLALSEVVESEDRVGFFCRLKYPSRWFFDIYIQGSKYNFLELSLK